MRLSGPGGDTTTKRITPHALTTGWADGWPHDTPVGMFLEQIRQGNTQVVAALTSGLDPGDMARWTMEGGALLARARGKPVARGRRPYADFAVALARAEAEAEAAMVDVIRDVALADVKDSWRAAAWMLDHQARAAPPIPEHPEDDDDLAELSSPVFDGEE